MSRNGVERALAFVGSLRGVPGVIKSKPGDYLGRKFRDTCFTLFSARSARRLVFRRAYAYEWRTPMHRLKP